MQIKGAIFIAIEPYQASAHSVGLFPHFLELQRRSGFNLPVWVFFVYVARFPNVLTHNQLFFSDGLLRYNVV